MKLSILIPTYNDCESITKTFDSILSQTYNNYEVIIINDGSTDDTDKIIKDYINKNNLSNKFTYIQEENKDQLLALIYGSKFITGDYVYILHSDDILASKDCIKKAMDYVCNNKDIDGILPNILIVDKEYNFVNEQKLLNYIKKDKTLATSLLWLGRNLYSDVPLVKKEVFLTSTMNNYLIWNRPFWLNITDDGASMLNIKNVDFYLLKYRIYDGNYANNELGLMCLLNGELRTAISLMHFYYLPFFRLQYLTFRIFTHLKIFKYYKPLYFKKESKNKYKLIKFVISKRYPNGYNNIFYDSLLNFYKNKNTRTVCFESLYINGEEIYVGNNLRTFNKRLLDNSLPKTYYNFFREMNKGFNIITVKKSNRKKLDNILKFLDIYYDVTVRSDKSDT